jgi:hypothetical protein
VDCLESVVWGMKQEQRKVDDCWMMTGLCRDVFRTGQLTEFAGGLAASAKLSSEGGSCTMTNNAVGMSFWLALSAGLLASFMICQVIRGAFATKPRPIDSDEERFSGIQFTSIRNGDSSYR